MVQGCHALKSDFRAQEGRCWPTTHKGCSEAAGNLHSRAAKKDPKSKSQEKPPKTQEDVRIEKPSEALNTTKRRSHPKIYP